MNNIEDLRKEILQNIQELKKGKLSIKEAESINNAAGKVRDMLMVELKYAHLRKEKPEIDFLNVNNQKRLSG